MIFFIGHDHELASIFSFDYMAILLSLSTYDHQEGIK